MACRDCTWELVTVPLWMTSLKIPSMSSKVIASSRVKSVRVRLQIPESGRLLSNQSTTLTWLLDAS